MRADRLRLYLIGLIAVAAALSVVGKKIGSPFVVWLSFAVFLGAVFLYASWRREVRRDRASIVFDRAAKTSDETRTGPDE